MSSATIIKTKRKSCQHWLMLGLHAVQLSVPHHVLSRHQTSLAETWPRQHPHCSLRHLRQGHHQQLHLFPQLPDHPPHRGHHPLRVRHRPQVPLKLRASLQGQPPSLLDPRPLLHLTFPPLDPAQPLHRELQRQHCGKQAVGEIPPLCRCKEIEAIICSCQWSFQTINKNNNKSLVHFE